MSYSILSYFYTNKPQCLKGGGQIVKIDQFGHTGDDFFLLWALRTRLKQMLNVEFCRIHEYWILAFCFLPLDKITAFQTKNYSQESDILRKLISVEDCCRQFDINKDTYKIDKGMK